MDEREAAEHDRRAGLRDEEGCEIRVLGDVRTSSFGIRDGERGRVGLGLRCVRSHHRHGERPGRGRNPRGRVDQVMEAAAGAEAPRVTT